MKKILSLLLINISVFMLAQESAFIINNKQVVWQRIYNSDKNIDEVSKILLSSGKIKINYQDSNSITGDVSDFVMDYKGAGFSKMGTPMYLSNTSKFYGNFKIDFKEGKYRVLLTNILSKGNSVSLFYGGVGISDNGNDNLETFALTNDRELFKASFEGKQSRIINYSFAQLFDVSKYTKTDDNW
ncbi:hypothetical protein [Chryseobacterium rhizosphaerae]|uniref:hypothetical protein n=1 Tax=Chryseobacterium rhizosphaerae TaxID=395937 RepID=UPI003D101BC1